MASIEPVNTLHPDFQFFLDFKDRELMELYHSLRAFILKQCPGVNELLYHTHALTSVYTVSEKLSDAFCMIPVYTNHLNLGFNKGTLIADPAKLLQGTGTLIRHIPIRDKKDFDTNAVKKLVKAAFDLAIKDSEGGHKHSGAMISKIKR